VSASRCASGRPAALFGVGRLVVRLVANSLNIRMRGCCRSIECYGLPGPLCGIRPLAAMCTRINASHSWLSALSAPVPWAIRSAGGRLLSARLRASACRSSHSCFGRPPFPFGSLVLPQVVDEGGWLSSGCSTLDLRLDEGSSLGEIVDKVWGRSKSMRYSSMLLGGIDVGRSIYKAAGTTPDRKPDNFGVPKVSLRWGS